MTDEFGLPPVKNARRRLEETVLATREILAEISAEQERISLWQDVDAAAMLRDAEVAREEACAVRAAREAQQQARWRSRAMAAELGFDPDRLGL